MYQELEILGTFPGAHRPPMALDRVMFTRIPRERLEPERTLFQHKWWDYRFMHPTLATSYYAHCYKSVYRTIWRRHMDHRSAGYVAGIKADDIFELPEGANEKARRSLNNTVAACWRGRQVADAMGIPYETYIELAMTKAMSWSRKYLPRPSQLYSDEIIEAVQAGWDELTAGKFLIANDPRYRIGQWQGTPAQIAHESWVCTQIARRTPGTRAYLLHRHLWVDPVIRGEIARARFGDDEIERAKLAA
jgi:hypothetical protein